MDNFAQEKKRVVWVIEIEANGKSMTHGSGYAVKGKRIITCASLFTNYDVIRARRLDQENFAHEMEVTFMKPRWDTAMLKFKNEPAEFEYGNIANNGQLEAGEMLYSIGHPSEFVGSFMIGLAAYACADNVSPSIFNKNSICANHIPTACQVTPDYRVIGDVYNASSLGLFPKESVRFVQNLNPLIPIIQCTGIIFVKGCEGGPVFKSNGDIVGMLAMDYYGFAIAIHSSALNEFISKAAENDNLM